MKSLHIWSKSFETLIDVPLHQDWNVDFVASVQGLVQKVKLDHMSSSIHPIQWKNGLPLEWEVTSIPGSLPQPFSRWNWQGLEVLPNIGCTLFLCCCHMPLVLLFSLLFQNLVQILFLWYSWPNQPEEQVSEISLLLHYVLHHNIKGAPVGATKKTLPTEFLQKVLSHLWIFFFHFFNSFHWLWA